MTSAQQADGPSTSVRCPEDLEIKALSGGRAALAFRSEPLQVEVIDAPTWLLLRLANGSSRENLAARAAHLVGAESTEVWHSAVDLLVERGLLAELKSTTT